jgi:hypothetical protein
MLKQNSIGPKSGVGVAVNPMLDQTLKRLQARVALMTNLRQRGNRLRGRPIMTFL